MLTTYWDHINTGRLNGPQAATLEFGEVRLPQAGGIYQIRWRCEFFTADALHVPVAVTAITDGWRGVSYPVRRQVLSGNQALEVELVAGPFNDISNVLNSYAYFTLDDNTDVGSVLSFSVYARYLGSIASMGPMSVSP